MSGTKSSAPGSADASESLLSFTVHSLPSPALGEQARRTAAGRWKMLAVLAVCAAPVVASYFTYFVIRPQARSNYSELIMPPRLDGEAIREVSVSDGFHPALEIPHWSTDRRDQPDGDEAREGHSESKRRCCELLRASGFDIGLFDLLRCARL